MSSNDASLYGIRRSRNLGGGKPITSSTALSFTSQLSSLISNSGAAPARKPASSQRLKAKKDDLFRAPARTSAKRIKRDVGASASSSALLEQQHTTTGSALDSDVWERSRRRMEDKARLYAAMKRGDVEDAEGRYEVDFDRKWAESADGADGEEKQPQSEDDSDLDEEDLQVVEYVDEFGRTRTGTRAQAGAAQRADRAQRELESDRFTARPAPPRAVIYGDTIQHQAFNPDDPVAMRMADLARKRDASLTPPPDEHFDARREVRNKGTGFFQFSADAAERRAQMDGLERERAETERRRKERNGEMEATRELSEEQQQHFVQQRNKRKADDFLDALGEELAGRPPPDAGTDMTNRIEKAVRDEKAGDD